MGNKHKTKCGKFKLINHFFKKRTKFSGSLVYISLGIKLDVKLWVTLLFGLHYYPC